MKKLIEIPNDIVIDLKVMAANDNLNLKKWIENELVKRVEESKLKMDGKKGRKG